MAKGFGRSGYARYAAARARFQGQDERDYLMPVKFFKRLMQVVPYLVRAHSPVLVYISGPG